jgi:hypothetical protein
MTNYKYLRGASISDPSRVIFDIPDAPTIGTATDVGTSRAYNNGAATVAITSQAVTGGPTTGYTVTSTPDSFTGSGTSPITVTGLSSGTSYTFTAKATNTSGSSPASSATGAITATTVPQAPTIGTFTDGGTGTTGTLSFTAGATGGKSITGYKVSTDGSTYTTVSGTTSPLSLTGLTSGTYTFYLKATNANGDSAASSGVSGTVVFPSNFYSIATTTVGAGGVSSITFSSIPITYTHLQIRGIGQSTTAGTGTQDYQLMFNGDALSTSNTNYTQHRLYGNGASAFADYTNGSIMSFRAPNSGRTNIFGTAIIDILDYSNVNKYKTVKSLTGVDINSAATVFGTMWLTSGVYVANTNAITSITIGSPTANLAQYSSFALYGVK